VFAKVFTQIFDSSISGDYVVRHVFMDLLVLADCDGVVDMTVDAIARRTNVPKEVVAHAIKELMAPDTQSRSIEEDGRRMTPLDSHRDWGWQIVNYDHYRRVHDDEARRTYFRDKKRESRAANRKANPSTPVHASPATSKTVKDSQRLSTQAEAEAEVIKKPSRAKREGPTETEAKKTRHAEFKEAIKKYWKHRNPNVDIPWDVSEGANLDIWLRSSPGTTIDQFKQYLQNRAKSEVNHADRPSKWIRNVSSFASGPLDRFGQPLNSQPTLQLSSRPEGD
jgi:hypothetical protein